MTLLGYVSTPRPAKEVSGVAKSMAIGITARKGVSAPLARYCLKMVRPTIMLPTLQMIEIYVMICAAVGELISPALPLSLQARNPTFVERSTVAFEYKMCASGVAEMKAGHGIPANWSHECSNQLCGQIWSSVRG